MSETSVPPAPPTPLVPVDQRGTLVDRLVAAVSAAVNADPARDAADLELTVEAALRDVEDHLDVDGGDASDPVYATIDDIDPRVFKGLRDLAAAELRRPGAAFGTVGYDDADPFLTRTRGAVFAALGYTKRRWGVA